MRFCFFLALLVTLNACGNNRTIAKPPATFTEADLIGTWKSVSKLHASDTLSIRANHTFTQYYTIDPQKVPTEVDGTWQLEYRAIGCVYVHFEKMRYIYQTEDTMTSGNREANGDLIEFREFCEETRITMPDKVILSIGRNPDAPRGIELRFPCAAGDCLDNVMELVR
jgi:hypothetical protein